MRMVKQELGTHQCGLRAVAMVTDTTREDLLEKFPDYERRADADWLNYMKFDLGLTVEDTRDEGFDHTLTCNGKIFSGHLKLPLGFVTIAPSSR
jgi:hypothetical protein